MAACLFKKKEFMQVGHFCSIVLIYNPYNVKALYRRATTAIELGRNELALWDLELALEFEPSNQEVAKKLSKVKDLRYNVPIEHSQTPTVSSSNFNLSSPRKPSDGRISMEQEEAKKSELGMMGSKGGMMEEDACSVRREGEENQGDQESNKMDEILRKVGGSLKEENIEVPKVTCAEEVTMKEVGSKNDGKRDHPTLFEPKYQFRHKKRMGSSLIISKREDYHLLAQGNSIHLYNPKTGEAMSISVLSSPNEKSSKLHENQGAKGQEEMETLMEESQDEPKIDKVEEVYGDVP